MTIGGAIVPRHRHRRRRRLGALTWVLAVVVAIDLRGSAAGTEPVSRRFVVISDLHLGVGRDGSSGDWHPYEDFRWPSHLQAFLDSIGAGGVTGTDLIVNGDLFELWQGLGRACPYDDASAGCSEAEASARLDRVLSQHAAEIEALGRFAGSGTNRLVIVPGDHDAALIWPALAARVIDRLAAPAGRATVASEGYWVSDDGRILVEHGHQVPFEANATDGWPVSFLTVSGETRLARSWGERLTQPLVNELERRYPLVDNVAQEGLGLKSALSETAPPGLDAGALLRFFLFKMPWLQFRSDLEEETAIPAWDLAAIRSGGDTFLIESLLPDDPIRGLAARARDAGELGLSVSDLTDAELRAICDYRAALRRARRRNEQAVTQVPRTGAVVRECPRQRDTVGAQYQYFWGSRDEAYARFVTSRVDTLRSAGRLQGEPELVVVSHTHLAHRPFVPVPGGGRPLIVNPGAFQRVIFPAHLEGIMQAEGRSAAEALAAVGLEGLPSCYGFLELPSTEGRLAPSPRYWRMAGASGAVVEPRRDGSCAE